MNIRLGVPLIAAIGLIAIVGCASSQLAKDDPSFASDDKLNALNEWMQNYYKYPHPKLFFASFDLLNRNRHAATDGQPALVTFYGELFRRHPEQVNGWVTRIESWTLSDISEWILWNSLQFSGTPQAESILKARLENAAGTRKEILKIAIARRPEDFDGGGKIRWVGDLDALWGRFYATGNKSNVMKIISALEKLPEKWEGTATGAEAMDALVGAAAEWSLTANSRQHKDVMAICKEEINQTSSNKIRRHLEKIVAEAEKRR